MGTSKSFTVDLADPQSIPSKLPQAERELADLEAQLQRQVAEVLRWRQMVSAMRNLTGGGNLGGSSLDSSHLTKMQKHLVEVVNRDVRKIRAKEITEILHSEGFPYSNESVSNCLWYLAEKVQPRPIQRVGRGFYAPLAYQEPEMTPAEAAGSLIAGVGLGAVAASAASGLLKGGSG
jgi:hypothetical protein